MPATQKPLRFPNPFGGHPAPVRLSRLFLLDPATFVKLLGFSMRGLLEEITGEAFYKKWERISTGQQAASPEIGLQLLSKMAGIMSIPDDLRAALEGDEEAQQVVNSRGSWESFFLGSGRDLARLKIGDQFILAIERACALPERLVFQGDIPAAAKLLSADPVVAHFFWPEALEILGQCQFQEELLPLQASIALEVQLSYLAAVDVGLADTRASQFAPVFPSSLTRGLNPTSLFYRHLQSQIGVRSMAELLKHPKAQGLAIDMTTLKRWSAGAHHPDLTWLLPLLRAFFPTPEVQALMDLYWAAKYINMLGFLGQRPAQRAMRYVGTDLAQKLRPWPEYPFGSADFVQWIERRYPIWLDYHHKTKEKGEGHQDGTSPPNG